MAQTSKTPASDHDVCHRGAAAICDQLFATLAGQLPGLKRDRVKRWCCISQPGQKRFAYIAHRKKQLRLEIWFLGDPPAQLRFASLSVRERTPTSGGFGKDFKARFYLDEAKDVQSACDLLIGSAAAILVGVGNRSSDSFAEEVNPQGLYEGAVRQITVNAYERSPEAVRQCKRHHGTTCVICGFDFGAVYGAEFAGFIHVHHLRPLSEVGGEYQVDPVKDLLPVCPNCHAIIHHGGQVRSVDDVRQLLAKQRGSVSDGGA